MSLGIKFTVAADDRTQTLGQGQVVNISSSGVAFRTSSKMTPGAAVQASMDWPVTLNGDCILRVSMEGRVVRTAEHGLVVMSVAHYEFRTGGRVSAPRAEIEAAKRSFASASSGNEVRVFA